MSRRRENNPASSIDCPVRKTWSSVNLAQSESMMISSLSNGQSDTKSDSDQRGEEDRMEMNDENLFDYNAWDNVEWDESHLVEAGKRLSLQMESRISHDIIEEKYRDEMAALYWDKFYSKHTEKFFKNRNWFHSEFPEIYSYNNGTSSSDIKDSANFRLLEVGCGVGNSVEPILEHYRNDSSVHIYACDFSQVAVDILKSKYSDDSERRNLTVFQYDLASADPLPIEPASLDIILMVFVLSAIAPSHHIEIFKKLAKLLKPGGMILFRDYGRLDLTQLRFGKNRLLAENFYVRGDDTQVYFFENDEVAKSASEAGLEVVQNAIDKRLLVNRKKKLKMYRCWVQLKLRRLEI